MQSKPQEQKKDESWELPEVQEKVDEYLHGINEDEAEDVKSGTLRRELIHNRSDAVTAARSAARSEMLRTGEAGYIREKLTQREILKEIPVAIAARKFDFELPNGPYVANITANGRGILLGGAGGHFASFDWYSGTKFFEIFPEQEVRDVTYLQNDTMCAMATNHSVYIHDKSGILVHDLGDHKQPLKLVFLPQHWLLVSSNERGRLVYTDVTSGATVANIRTKRGTPQCMCFNRHNGVISLGHTNGVVSFWTPNQEEPAATVFTHRSAVTAVDIDFQGERMVTAGTDGSVKIWDLRNFETSLSKTYDRAAASAAKFSAKGILGVARGTRLEFYPKNKMKAFLTHDFKSQIHSLQFVTFDDFAICGTDQGVSSVVVPGSGEPNIDSNVANPFETTRWRQEQEVRRLLDKIPYDMITMDSDGPFKVGRRVDKQKQRAKELDRHRQVKVEPEEKAHGTKAKRLSMEERLQRMKQEYYKEKIEEKRSKLEQQKGEENTAEEEAKGPLARFKKVKSRSK